MLSNIDNFYLNLPSFELTYTPQLHHHFLFLGSCFSENMSEYFREYKLSCSVNPTGITFNPLSIADHIVKAGENSAKINKEHMVINEAMYKHLDYHSQFNHALESEVTQRIMEAQIQLKEEILKANFVFITLGTAWVYKFRKTNEIINNCQKVPNKEFDKLLLTEVEILESLKSIFHTIKQFNPECKILFTISPVRHIKNGLWENNVSKGRLQSALFELKKHVDFDYFPSYEILIDVLRDYRFYAEDKIHPNSIAKKFIWEILKDRFFKPDSAPYFQMQGRINKLLQHRSPKGHHPHMEKIRMLEEEMQLKYPKMTKGQ